MGREGDDSSLKGRDDCRGNINLLGLKGSYNQDGSSSTLADSAIGAGYGAIGDVELMSGIKFRFVNEVKIRFMSEEDIQRNDFSSHCPGRRDRGK